MVGSFATGDWPHDNHFSEDGELLYNGSIGNIVTPEEARGPGSYELTAVDPETLEVVRSYEFERGIRPYVLTRGRPPPLRPALAVPRDRRVRPASAGRSSTELELPVDEGVTEDDWDFEAPHHGLAISPDEKMLCAAGRASDYVALVATGRSRRARSSRSATPPAGRRTARTAGAASSPTTATTPSRRSPTASAREVARIPVGDGPKHIEPARVPAKVLTK